MARQRPLTAAQQAVLATLREAGLSVFGKVLVKSNIFSKTCASSFFPLSYSFRESDGPSSRLGATALAIRPSGP